MGKIDEMKTDIAYSKTGSLLEDAKVIIESSKRFAYSAINIAITRRNWLLGRRISEEDLHGEKRAAYGKQIIKKLSEELTNLYGKGFDTSNLYKYSDFYQTFPNLDAVRLNSLSWSHYRILLQVENAKARSWYEKEAAMETWSTRTLQRNISSQYYERTLLSQNKELVKSEMRKLTKPLQDKLEFIKNPIVAEFLGLSQNMDFTESKLERAIITNIQKFLMELGKGYAFVARQQHIHTEKEDYYIDLVFYHRILKCFVLIDLKRGEIQHEDIGQMNFYLNYYREEMNTEGDTEPIGIVLGAYQDKLVMQYALQNISNQVFTSRYQLYLPEREQLEAELQRFMNDNGETK